MSAKRIFQLVSPTEKLADCSVGTSKTEDQLVRVVFIIQLMTQA
jgi:hypothetical protein